MAVAERLGRVMASRLHVITVLIKTGEGHGRSCDLLEQAIDRTVRYVEHLERCWSRFIATSDVSRINRLGSAGGTLPVDPSTLTLLETMVDGYERTSGRFDPTLLRALMAEGYDASVVDPTMCSRVGVPASSAASLHDMQLDPIAKTVTVPPGLVLDPGGIGKGLAADLAVARLLDEGVDGAMVEIGGDLAAAGTPAEPAGWLVDVERPDPDDGLLCSLAMSSGGVATSSVRSRRWIRDGTERHHQIDPRTGTSSTTDLTAVTVIAPTGWLAEVHATAALAVGGDKVIGYLDGHGLSGLAVAAVPDGKHVMATADLGAVDPTFRCGVA